MSFEIAVLAGDGIGPEICDGAVKVLTAVEKKFNRKFIFKHYLIGGAAIDACGAPLPPETVKGCLESDSVLLGAVGGYKWDNLSGDNRPEKGLLRIRKEMGLYSNVRPAKLWKSLAAASPLKNAENIDITIVRELTGGIYFGKREKGENWASDEERYSVEEIERICEVACRLAMNKDKKIASVDKANVLETSRLWRKTVHAYCEKNYPEIYVYDVLVDNMAMQLVKNPAQFSVVVTSNLFGDILSDEAAQITGSIGMLASSSLGNSKRGLYEPIHGSAPDIAGQDVANPIATILAAAMMLKDSFDLDEEYRAVENAVERVLEKGYRTADIFEKGATKVGCKKMAELIAAEI